MQFDYEIPAYEYGSAQVMYYHGSHRRLIKKAIGWGLAGLLFVLTALFRFADFGPFLLLLTGLWFIYIAIVYLFPMRQIRRYYSKTGLAGKTYHAEADESGFSVTGNSCSWRALWTETSVKRENKRVFLFVAKETLFIFGKQYLTEEQQNELRRLAAPIFRC
jgi:hypothetical protein